jgi:hypothetical protein
LGRGSGRVEGGEECVCFILKMHVIIVFVIF